MAAESRPSSNPRQATAAVTTIAPTGALRLSTFLRKRDAGSAPSRAIEYMVRAGEGLGGHAAGQEGDQHHCRERLRRPRPEGGDHRRGHRIEVLGTAAIYVAFLLIALAALIARLRGTWKPAGRVQLGRLGVAINALAVAWLAFETVNIAWPRESLAPLDAPVYQVWAAPLVLALIAVVGFAYLLLARPQRRLER
jgi:hypothetical protein